MDQAARFNRALAAYQEEGCLSGYVRLYRDLIDHAAFRNDAEAMAFAWLFARASWKPVRVRYKGHAITLGRGQLAVSIRDMAEALDRDKAWIERLFKRLKSETMIETRSETGVSVVTIVNYDKYQPCGDERETPGETRDETPDETPARQTRDTEQRTEIREEVSSEAKASSPPMRAWRCPDGVQPPHWRDFLDNRKRKRLGFSATAYAHQLGLLAKFADDDWPPGKLVEHAAAKGWGTIVDPSEYETPRNVQRPANDHRKSGDPARDINHAADKLRLGWGHLATGVGP